MANPFLSFLSKIYANPYVQTSIHAAGAAAVGYVISSGVGGSPQTIAAGAGVAALMAVVHLWIPQPGSDAGAK